jgi:internalin A
MIMNSNKKRKRDFIMKKTPFVLLALLLPLVLSLVACGAPAATETPSPEVSESTPVETPEPTGEPTPEPVVVFTDTVLEGLVRKAMNKPEGDITLAEAEAVTMLDLQMDGNDYSLPRIEDVSDLKQFPNLTSLALNWALFDGDGDEDFDLSPLAGLTKLECLYICCANISDISALSGMTNMKDLWIWGNRNITDISALAGMTQIESLWIKGNQITDISVLANMKNLVYLYMQDNQVADLSPLAGLTKLTHVLLSGNPATDYSPLKDVYPNLEEKDFEMN